MNKPEYPATEALKILEEGRKVLYATLKAQGIGFVRAYEQNRDLNDKHVNELVKSGKINSFFNSIKVLTVKEYFTYYPNRRLLADDGTIVTKDSENLEMLFVILDGQHREAAEKELLKDAGYVPSLMVELISLPEGMTPDQCMKALNLCSFIWNSQARTKHIVNTLPDGEANIKLAAEWQKLYKMGERCCYAILTLKDIYRKSFQVDYMDNPEGGLHPVLKGTKEQRERGLVIFHAFEIGFRHHPRLLRNMTAIKFVISELDKVRDTQKPKLLEKLLLFFQSFDATAVDAVDEAPSTGKGSKEILIKKSWDRFKKGIKTAEGLTEAQEKALKAEKEWADMMADKLQENN